MKQFTGILVIIAIIITVISSVHAVDKGRASFYETKKCGIITASGVPLHDDSMYCANTKYPFGTLLRVKNLRNGKEVIVKVIDRGPYKKGRIIDLTFAAALQLDMIEEGVVPVEVSVYHPNSTPVASLTKISASSPEVNNSGDSIAAASPPIDLSW